MYALLTNVEISRRLLGNKLIEVYEGKADPQVYGCFLVFRRDVFEKEEFFEGYKAIYDREFMARLTHKGYKVFFSKELFVFHPVPATLSKSFKTIRVQAMWLGSVGKKCPILTRYHAFLLASALAVLLLSLFVSPLIFALAFIGYTALQFASFEKIRQDFLMSRSQLFSLVALTYCVAFISIVGFGAGLFVKPKKYWK